MTGPQDAEVTETKDGDTDLAHEAGRAVDLHISVESTWGLP